METQKEQTVASLAKPLMVILQPTSIKSKKTPKHYDVKEYINIKSEEFIFAKFL